MYPATAKTHLQGYLTPTIHISPSNVKEASLTIANSSNVLSLEIEVTLSNSLLESHKILI
jgi:hypothetical protein